MSPGVNKSKSKKAIMFKYILKRNGAKVSFDPEKITNAVFKSASAVGSPDWKKAEEISKMILDQMEAKFKKNHAPTVEEVQDLVEKVLIENGMAKVAKAYILYRQHRAELRKEKAQILNKEEIDEVDKNFDTNALRVLVSRYLRKSDQGEIIESPKELFIRVATHATIPSFLYDAKVFKKAGKKNLGYTGDVFDPKKFEGKLAIGKYILNENHLKAVKRLFDRFAKNGQMKISWSDLIVMIKRGHLDKYEKEIQDYYDLMVSRKFMPNTPAIANFGNSLAMGSACFVLDVEDDINAIMDTLKSASIIFKSGGGVGYNFSKLRPEGDFVKSTGGVASGPLSFMSMFDNMTDVIKQGGIRRGANMGIMNSNHPDIVKFIKAKEGNKGLRNFNISVLLMDDFWKYYEKKEPYPLVNPRTKKITAYVDARQLFDMIAYQAWESAEPGVIFYDKVNEFNPFFDYLGPIVTTNPCGEVLLYPNESCNLGSINVWAFVKKRNGNAPSMDWEGLEKAVRLASRFLDNVVDVNLYPLQSIEDMALYTRKTGLGIMGVADLLYELELGYNSKSGLDFMSKLMEFVNYYSKIVSVDMAKSRGVLPSYNQSFYKDGKLPFSGFQDKKSWNFKWDELSKDIKKFGIRNGYTTVIAPTGSISMLAGCSSGIEPVFSLVFEKHITVGNFYYVDPVFEDVMHREGLMDDDLIKDVANHKGTVMGLSYIPEKMKKIYVTAQDITPKDHIYALAAFQKWTDSSISKTNNLPADATIDDVKETYLLAYKLGCKDVTVYRDGSLVSQVLVSGKSDSKKDKGKKKEEDSLVSLKDEKAKGLAVYKESGSNSSDDSSLGLSPALTSASGDANPKVEEDGIEFNGQVKCKLCNS